VPLSLILALLATGGCSATEAPIPHFDWQTPAPWIQRWVKAPIIVVGKVASISRKGQNSIQRTDGTIGVRLLELGVDVENVIQGALGPGRIRVYRYGYESGQLPGNIPIDDIFPGERRILFLLPHRSDYRLIEDIVASSLAVGSGAHHRFHGDTVLEQIAGVLLLPGEGFDEEQYARYLSVQSGSQVLAIVGFRRTALLLNQVMSRGPRKVSAEACLALYNLYPFGHDCIEGLLHRPGTPESTRAKALETAKVYGNGKRKELEQFRKRPVEWFNLWIDNEKGLGYVSLSYKDDARFLLGQLTQQDDPVIQRNARMLIADYLSEL